MRELDQIDRTILHHLQQNARMTNLELARLVALSGPGLQKRLKRLEEDGVIERYVTLINRERIGFDLLCFVQVSLQRHRVTIVNEFQQAIQAIPEVMECYHITGATDYLLKVVVRSRQHLEHFLVEVLTPIPGVDHIQTHLVLSDVKASTALPLRPGPDET